MAADAPGRCAGRSGDSQRSDERALPLIVPALVAELHPDRIERQDVGDTGKLVVARKPVARAFVAHHGNGLSRHCVRSDRGRPFPPIIHQRHLEVRDIGMAGGDALDPPPIGKLDRRRPGGAKALGALGLEHLVDAAAVHAELVARLARRSVDSRAWR